MTTLYDKILDYVKDGVDNARLQGLIDQRQQEWFNRKLEDLVDEFEDMQREIDEIYDIDADAMYDRNNSDPEVYSFGTDLVVEEVL